MNSLIAQYIEEELLRLHSVELPWVGVLYVERQSATIDEHSGLLTPPYDTLELSAEDINEDDFYAGLGYYLQQLTKVGSYLAPEQFYERAVREYDEWWREYCDEEGVLTITEVCAIDTARRRIVAIDANLLALLLPYSEPLVLSPHSDEAVGEEVVEEEEIIMPVEAVPQRIMPSLRVAHIHSFWVVLSIVLFVCSILYIGYLLYQCHYPLK